MIQRLIEHPRFPDFDLSTLKLMLYGAAPIDDSLLTQRCRHCRMRNSPRRMA